MYKLSQNLLPRLLFKVASSVTFFFALFWPFTFVLTSAGLLTAFASPWHKIRYALAINGNVRNLAEYSLLPQLLCCRYRSCLCSGLVFNFVKVRTIVHFTSLPFTFVLTSAGLLTAFASPWHKIRKKKRANALIGIKNSWKYEKDYLYLMKKTSCFKLVCWLIYIMIHIVVLF